jgi:hypothetical protein
MQKIYEIRINPSSSLLDALLELRLGSGRFDVEYLIKWVLLNHFASQDGGIGLSEEDQLQLIALQPRLANRKRGKDAATQKSGGAE